MAKRFTVIYPDSSKKNISASEKEQMLLAGELSRVDERNYRFVGEVHVYHSFQDLFRLLPSIEGTVTLRRFYPGLFVREHKGKRVREMLESAEAMALRLRGKFQPIPEKA